jgi:threonine synthase
VQKGAIPFGVQGPDNGLAIEGARTIAFEMAEAFHAAGVAPAAIGVQVGGGALASAITQGFAIAVELGLLAERPRLIAVQTAGCAPLARAWQSLRGIDLIAAARHRSRFMRPWETIPHSIAHGILDDETYDWWEIAKGMRETNGHVIAVGEADLERAHALAQANTAIRASATGTAGFAGCLLEKPGAGPVAVLFSGAER